MKKIIDYLIRQIYYKKDTMYIHYAILQDNFTPTDNPICIQSNDQ